MAGRLPIAFAGSPLDRADALRGDPVALARLAALPDARMLTLAALDPAIGDNDALVWEAMPAAIEGGDGELVFLGLTPGGDARFAPVPAPDDADVAPPASGIWAAMATLPADALAIYGTARALVGWHARYRFCARCGGATRLAKGGWQRDCVRDTCGAQHFPRTDPVVIMAVEHGGALLLGRQPRFVAGRFSALAGFVEPGESMEEAVAREVWEEAGVRVHDITYVASQPWPFPHSLMLACRARADSRTLTIDHAELEDAQWFTRDQVASAMRRDPHAAFDAPPRHAIAWHLLDHWLCDV